MSSRIIVKHLPPYASEDRLKEFFATVGEVTDTQVRRRDDGISRNFGFVGFRTEAEALEAVNKLNRSFFDTTRIFVEIAQAPGSVTLQRAWSRYTPGTSAHQRYEKQGEEKVEKAKEFIKKQEEANKAKRAQIDAALKGATGRKVKTSKVKSGKAGVNNNRVHVELGSGGEEDGENALETSQGAPARSTMAFDDEMDDLAYLRGKMSKAPLEKEEAGEDSSAAVEAQPPEEASGGAAAASVEAAGTEEDGEQDEPSDRLYVRNLPYGATEDELRAHFDTLGEVSSVVVCKDEDSGKARGFGYVTFVFPECAVRAQAELHLQAFQGRVLFLEAAKAKPAALAPEPSNVEKFSTKGSNYKKKLQERRKKVDAHLEHTWNLLYVSSNAATEAASSQLGVSKSELIGKDAENAALTAALAETSVIQQTKQWLVKEGICVEAFQQSGQSLAQSRVPDKAGTTRLDDTFIVKHLPAGASSQELRERFARFGELVRCSVAPSGTVGIVQYTDKERAKRAFQKLAFSRYKHVPLYLEWAPGDVFTQSGSDKAEAIKARKAAAGEDDDEAEEAAQGCLFVKNLNFSTTEATLKSVFSGCRGFRAAVIMKKKTSVKAMGKEAQTQSMGYGFVEFDKPEHALEALKRKQSIEVESHALQLQVSNRRSQQVEGRSTAQVKKSSKGGAVASERLCVRNLAFETTRKDLHRLFGAYGSVKAVRMPKKADYTGHRGFGFVDFASKSEAAAAMEALQHTHLYGRRLVLEPSTEAQGGDIADVQATSAKRQAARGLHSEAKKRKKSSMLNTAGEGGGAGPANFMEAFT